MTQKQPPEGVEFDSDEYTVWLNSMRWIDREEGVTAEERLVYDTLERFMWDYAPPAVLHVAQEVIKQIDWIRSIS